MDDGFHLIRDLGWFGFDGVVDGLDFCFQAHLVCLEVRKLGDQGGVVPRFGEETV